MSDMIMRRGTPGTSAEPTSEAERFFDQRFAERFSRSELTMLDDKAAAYAAEANYRETLYELARRFGSGDGLACVLRRTGVGLFRPDAIAHHKVADTLAYFDGLGIRPVRAMRVDVTGHVVRDIWRYQLNVASGHRLRLLDLVFGASPSLLVLFNAGPGVPDVPCAVLMADCKGAADVHERQGWELRAFLRSPNRVEVYFHCCDEPADVVRDGGLLAGPDGLAWALALGRDPRAATTVRGLARDIAAAAVPRGSTVDADPLLLRGLGHVGGNGHFDRWELVREVAEKCAMASGTAEALISDSGIRRWWMRTGLLGERDRYLADGTGWTGGQLVAPLP
jgi:hypothetical protein